MHCNCNRLIALLEHFYHQSSMGSIYIKDRWGHRTGSGAMISILSPREELTTILLFSEAGIVHIVQIHHGADKLLRLPVGQLGTDGQGRVSPHSFQSLSHSVTQSVSPHHGLYRVLTRIVPNPGCFRSFQGVRPNPNDASFGFDRVELSVEASMDKGSWELPAEGGQTYRKLGLEPFNLTGLPVRTAQK